MIASHTALGINPVASHSGAFGMPILTVIVLIPAVAAVLVALFPKRLATLARGAAMVASLATLGFAIALTIAFHTHTAGYQFFTRHHWISSFGISWELGVDGISLFLVLLTALIFPIVLGGAAATSAATTSATGARDTRAYCALMLLLEAACLGSFLSLDVFLFFLMFELTLVPAYFLIVRWGHGDRSYAAVKFFLYTLLGSAFFFVGMLVVAFSSEHAVGHLTFDLLTLTATHALATTTAKWLFLAFTAAFAVKAPIFPFHSWSPDAYSSAPAGASVVLAAIMAKLGTYGIIRFDLDLFPKASNDLAPLLLTLGVGGILYGAIVAGYTRDLKRLVAYSSLSHIGFIVLGLFALSPQALAGGVLQMINHGILVAGLFLLIAMIYRRRETWDVTQLSGLQKSAPVLAGVFTLVMLGAVGLPGLNGFVGEFLILTGTFVTHRWWAVVAVTGVILSVVYLLWAYQQAFHRKPTGANVSVADMTWAERLVMAPLVVLIVFLGVYPRPLLDRVTPTVTMLVHQVQAAGKTGPGSSTAVGGYSLHRSPAGGNSPGSQAAGISAQPPSGGGIRP